MPDPATTRLGLYKSKSDGSELVNYTQDLGQNWDKVDLATGYQIVTSSTRPGTPYPGKPITESDTSYRSYFHNGTAPASGGWVEIPNSSGTFGSDLKLSTTAKLVLGVDTNLYRSAANTLKTDDSLVVAGDIKPVNGTTTVRPQLASTVTVANTTTETVIATLTIPANDAVVGAIYRITVFGTASVTATPTFTVRARLGGVAGTLAATLGPVTASSGVTNQTWSADFDVVCLTTGGSGTWMPRFVMAQNVSVATVQTGTVVLPTGGASLTRDTTTSSDMVVTWAWSAASASNTATARAIARRIA